MKWTTVAGLVALATLALVAKAVFAPREVPPREVLERLRPILDDPGTEARPVLDVLGRALRHPDTRADDALAAEILDLRAQLFQRLGAYADARESLDRIRVVLDRSTPELDLRSAQLLSLQGQDLEAWQRVRGILEGEPEYGPAWALRGELERGQAERDLAQALERIDRAMAGDEAQRAFELARSLGHRDPQDPQRVRLASELRDLHLLVHEEQAGADALESLERASDRMRDAREAFARAVEFGERGPALESLLQLLERAGHGELAADLGTAARLVPGVTDDWRVLRAVVEAMLTQDQVERAARLLGALDPDVPDIDLAFLRTVASVQFRAAEWRGLAATCAALLRRGDEDDQAAAHWYLAHATVFRPAGSEELRRAALPRAAEGLDLYLGSDRPSYEPNMAALAHALKARIWRELGDTRLERTSLIGAFQEDPHLDPDLLVRLAELQRASSNVGYRIPVDNVTRAMALAPQRTGEWTELWQSYGEANLASQNMTLQAAWLRIRNAGRDPGFADPFTRWSVGRRALEEGETGLALSIGRELFGTFPGLLPALDLQIEARLAMDALPQAAALLVERLRLAGPDDGYRALLDRVGTEVLDDRQYLELLRHDPAGEGRLALASMALEDGDPELALRILRPEPEEGRAPIPLQDVLRAESYLRLDLDERAAEAAARALGDAHLAEQAWSLLLQARLAAPPEVLEQAVGDYLDREWIAVEGALDVCDRMLAGGRPDQALRIVQYLDQVPEARAEHGGAICARLALAAELLGDAPLRDDSLERAEPFLDDGRVELSRLVLALLDRTWTRVPALVEELRTTRFDPTPLQEAVLFLLEERLQEAEALLEEATQDQRVEPSWALVSGAVQLLRRRPVDLPPAYGVLAEEETARFLVGERGRPRDPREGLALLLALEVEGWGLWVLPRVVDVVRQGGGRLWPLVLGTRAHEDLGRADLAQEARVSLVDNFPTFTPGWDMLEQALVRRADGDSLAPEVLEVRVARLAAVGDAAPDAPLRRAVDEAASRHAAGDTAGALRSLSDLAREPEAHEARWLAARLLRSTRRSEEAVLFQKVALEMLPADRVDPHVPELLETLAEARAAQGRLRLPAQEALALLTDLELHCPRDPDLALARLALAVELDPAGTSLAVSRSRGALEAMRERCDGTPFEDLREGSALRWVRFLRRVSPALADEFLEDELPARPGSMPLWVERALTWSELGRYDEARVLLTRMTDASNDPEAQLALGLLLARHGGAPREVESHVQEARPNLAGLDRQRANFVADLAYSQIPGPRVARTIKELEQMWLSRIPLASRIPTEELAWAYVCALTERASREDREVLGQVAAELRSHAGDAPYQGSAARALEGLVRAMPVPQE